MLVCQMLRKAVESSGSRNGNDIEAVAVIASCRPKRTVKRPEILDPSYVSKRRPVRSAAADRQRTISSHRQRESSRA